MIGNKKWKRVGNILAISREPEGTIGVPSARDILRRHGMERAMPVPIVDLCRAEGLKDVFQTRFKDSKVSGMIRHTDQGSTIYVAEDQSPKRQRFTIAHELAHYVLHIRPGLEGPNLIDRADVYELYRQPGQADAREREANLFAAELLMPTAVLRQLADVYAPDQLAEFLAVSLEALMIRLRTIDG